jgi:hypothetical protein
MDIRYGTDNKGVVLKSNLAREVRVLPLSMEQLQKRYRLGISVSVVPAEIALNDGIY